MRYSSLTKRVYSAETRSTATAERYMPERDEFRASLPPQKAETRGRNFGELRAIAGLRACEKRVNEITGSTWWKLHVAEKCGNYGRPCETVRVGRASVNGRVSTGGWFQNSGPGRRGCWKIKLTPYGGMNDHVLLHEMAHVAQLATDGIYAKQDDDHGARFTAWMLALVWTFQSQERYRMLKAELDEAACPIDLTLLARLVHTENLT